MLAGKRILVGISGGIAAYKMPLLLRLLKQAGAEVRVVLSPSALDFVTPLTLSVCSGNPAVHQLFDSNSGTWINHVELALWADVMLIAPATANTLAAMAEGKSDNALLVTWLCTRCPVLIAPAMDEDMWLHASVKQHIQTLKARGVFVLPPEKGPLASSLYGEGRLPEPEQLMRYLELNSLGLPDLHGKQILISSGASRESLDPVRFLSNESTGKMGAALADAATAAGARVVLAHASHSQMPRLRPWKVCPFTTAWELKDLMESEAPQSDFVFMAAAVADYRPATRVEHKIKKGKDLGNRLDLVENPDILKGLANQPRTGTLIGFALETQDGMVHARLKKQQKGVDYLVLNSLEHPGAGFGVETNQVYLLGPEDQEIAFPLQSKLETAVQLIKTICT